MRKLSLSILALVAGVLLLTGFSTDNQSPKNAPSAVNVSNDYGSFTQYMQ